MSKFKKVIVKKLSEARILNQYPPQLLVHPSNPLHPEKPGPKNDSPFSKNLIKLRSVSNFKDQPLVQSSGLVSPLKSKLSQNTSYILKSKELPETRSRSTKKLPVHEIKPSEPNTQFLESKLESLLKLQQEKGLTAETFDFFQDLFDEIISKDLKYGFMLSKIRKIYTEWLDLSQSQSKVLLENYEKRLAEEKEENKLLHRKILKFSRENVDLGRTLEEKDRNFKTLQEYLLKVTSVDIDSLPQDKVSWKVVLSENKSYSDLCEKLKKKARSAERKQKDLMKLFWIMKQKGFPVEEIHEEIVNKKADQGVSVSVAGKRDFENFNEELVKTQERLKNFPDLQLSKVEPNSFTEKDSDSDDSGLS